MNTTYKQQILGELEKQFDKGKTIWQQDFPEGELQRTVPYNPVSGLHFSGIAETLLRNKALEYNYQDSRWVTSYQAQQQGWKMKHGAEKTAVKVGTSYYDRLTNRTVYKYHFLYNAEQVEGIPPLQSRRNRIPHSHKLLSIPEKKEQQIRSYCTQDTNDFSAAIAKTILATEAGTQITNSRNNINREQLKDFFQCYPKAMSIREEILNQKIREQRPAGIGY